MILNDDYLFTESADHDSPTADEDAAWREWVDGIGTPTDDEWGDYFEAIYDADRMGY